MDCTLVKMKKRIGIVGYGSLGKFLTEQILQSENYELAFVWNRDVTKLENLHEKYKIRELNEIVDKDVHLIVEVAHPYITPAYGGCFLQKADYMIGSPTTFADENVYEYVKKYALKYNRAVYVPSGAFWSGEDVKKMADNSTLTGLTVTMKKHPSAFKLESPLKEKNDTVFNNEVVLYEGPVRELCPLAPNNVNTMAAACIAGHNLGFDNVIGKLVSDPKLHDRHIVEIDIFGADGFHVHVVKTNPAKIGAVTGAATYKSFWSSVQNCRDKPPGLHLA